MNYKTKITHYPPEFNYNDALWKDELQTKLILKIKICHSFYTTIAAFYLFWCSGIKSALWPSIGRTSFALLMIPAFHFYDSIHPSRTSQITSPVNNWESYLLLKRVDRFSSSSFPSSKRNTRFAIITVSKRWAITSTYKPNYRY